MSRLLKGFRWSKGVYDLGQLVDARSCEDDPGGMQRIICDIDKTYLETHFESLASMARIALEAAEDKVTVAGASDVLASLRWDMGKPRPLYFVSSSPPQMRSVLEEKLTLDGLDWSSDTFKNQAYNLRKGRMDLLRQHVAYKSLAIFNLVRQAPAGATFFALGDNAESDAFIYLGIKMLVEERLSNTGFSSYLRCAGVEGDVAENLSEQFRDIPRVAFGGILIRQVPGYRSIKVPPLTDPIFLFDDFYQATLIFMHLGLIDPSRLWELTRRFHNRYGLTRAQITASLVAAMRDSKNSGFRDAIGTVLTRLNSSEQDAEKETDYLRQDLDAFHALTEDKILAKAQTWLKKLKAAV